MERNVITGMLVIVMAALFQAGAEEAPDKSSYNLFRPTPREFLRELTPDRPDKTESPFTVDAGHLQVEMDFATFTHDRENGVSTRVWNIAPVNFKIGLLNNADFQVVFDDYLNVKTVDHNTGLGKTQSGIGDVTTRLKINFWGNDGGQTAFGMMPFLKFPTSTAQLGNRAVEGGIILPLAITLPAGFDLGLETAFAGFQNGADDDFHAEFINSITVGHGIIGNLGAYVEFFSNVSTERGSAWEGTVDVGLVYALTKNIQLDGGCNIGVTRSADDLNFFTGITVRF